MHTVKLNGRDIPVGKIVCIGRNYAEHIKELCNQTPDKPVIFIKPANTIVPSGGVIVIPDYSNNCHHEIELAILIGKNTKGISAEEALDHAASEEPRVGQFFKEVPGTFRRTDVVSIRLTHVNARSGLRLDHHGSWRTHDSNHSSSNRARDDLECDRVPSYCVRRGQARGQL